MAALASSKVVNLTEFDRLRRGTPPADSVRLLSDCRDVALRVLLESLKTVRSQLAEDLFHLADASVERDVQNLCLEARGRLDAGWGALEDAFRRSFLDAVNRTLRPESAAPTPQSLQEPIALSLMDDDDLTERIAVGEAAAALKAAVEQELYPMLRRLALLLDREELEDGENPLGVEVVCESWARACREIADTVRARRVVLKLAEKRLAPPLAAAYRAVNQRLQNAGVLPDLRHGYRKPVKNPMPGPTAKAPSADDVLARLQRLIQDNPSVVTPNVVARATAGWPAPLPGFATVEGGAASVASRSAAFLTSLTQLQRGELPSALPEGVIAWDVLPRVDGSVNVLRELASSGLASFAGQVDSITIDVVAMLFDFIFDDAQIPDPIKALVGRLQIPVLKVALLDHAFFSSKAHPTRRLLDTISGATLRWGRDVNQDDPLYLKIADIVGRVQSDFDHDVQIFADLQQELECFLAEQEVEEQGIVSRSTEMLEQREQEEIGWVIAGEQIKQRIGPAVPAALVEFLLSHWQHVLKIVYARFGEDSPAWHRALATLDDLVWSVAPKSGVDERRRLVALLPDLLRRLHEGLDLIALSHAQRAPFLDTLVELHSTAVKAGLLSHPAFSPVASPSVWQERALAAAPEPATDATHGTPAEGELLVTRVSENEVEIEDVILVGGARSAPGGGDVFDERVNNLRRGDWVEFRQEGADPTRRRLSWISPRRGIFLFTAYPAANALSISPDALAHQFRNGSADLVHDEPIFDRAVNGMLDALQVRVQ